MNGRVDVKVDRDLNRGVDGVVDGMIDYIVNNKVFTSLQIITKVIAYCVSNDTNIPL